MTGKLLNSFRSGNLAEHLGIFLLKGTAAIAEFARPEDFGFDAIATLLRRDGDGNSYPEDSFIVQLKSYSQTKLEFTGNEVNWITSQRHPIFVALVELKSATIELYSTIFINQAVKSLPCSKVIVRFGESSMSPFLKGQKFMPWCGDGDDTLYVWLGDPVAKWTIGEIHSETWRQMVFDVLTAFMSIVRSELELLSLGSTSTISWSTNQKESIISTPVMAQSHPDELLEIAKRSGPYLYALMLRCMNGQSDISNKLMSSLIACSDALLPLGIVVDDKRRLQAVWEHKQKGTNGVEK